MNLSTEVEKIEASFFAVFLLIAFLSCSISDIDCFFVPRFSASYPVIAQMAMVLILAQLAIIRIRSLFFICTLFQGILQELTQLFYLTKERKDMNIPIKKLVLPASSCLRTIKRIKPPYRVVAMAAYFMMQITTIPMIDIIRERISKSLICCLLSQIFSQSNQGTTPLNTTTVLRRQPPAAFGSTNIATIAQQCIFRQL